MKKILNSPANYVDEMLAGLVAAHPEYYQLHGDSGKVVARAKAGAKGKVGIVTGGGSGHLPVLPAMSVKDCLMPVRLATYLPLHRLNRWLMRSGLRIKAPVCFASMAIMAVIF